MGKCTFGVISKVGGGAAPYHAAALCSNSYAFTRWKVYNWRKTNPNLTLDEAMPA